MQNINACDFGEVNVGAEPSSCSSRETINHRNLFVENIFDICLRKLLVNFVKNSRASRLEVMKGSGHILNIEIFHFR